LTLDLGRILETPRFDKGTRATISKRTSEMDTTAKYIKLVVPADRRKKKAHAVIEYS
jgi:hypothetical protein